MTLRQRVKCNINFKQPATTDKSLCCHLVNHSKYICCKSLSLLLNTVCNRLQQINNDVAWIQAPECAD